MIARVVKEVLSADVSEVIVVTGKHRDDVEALLQGYAVNFCHNERYNDGMTSSIQVGVTAATGQAYMICLGDMPLLRTEDYNSLIRSHTSGITVPVYKSRRGNPVVFSSAYRHVILDHAQPEGCRQLLEAFRSDVSQVKASDRILMDVDTPEHLNAWKEK